MRVPDAENQAALGFSAPTRNNSHYTWPSSGLENASKSLNHHEIKHRVDIVRLGVAERVTEEAGKKHSEGDEIPETDTFSDHSREKHGDGVAEKEAGVEEAKHGRCIGTVKRCIVTPVVIIAVNL